MRADTVVRVEEAVLAYAGHGWAPCALIRLAAVQAGGMSVIEAGTCAGLNRTEAHGLMDGWDATFAHPATWSEEARDPGYQEGFLLGQRLAVEEMGRLPIKAPPIG